MAREEKPLPLSWRKIDLSDLAYEATLLRDCLLNALRVSHDHTDSPECSESLVHGSVSRESSREEEQLLLGPAVDSRTVGVDPVVVSMVINMLKRSGKSSRRRACHFADALSLHPH